MAAAIVVATLLDKAYSLGLVAVTGASLAVCSLISVALAALVYNKLPYAAAAGAIFGGVSFVFAYIFPSVIFQNPLASIVPRLPIGLIGFAAYRLAGMLAKVMNAAARATRFPFALAVALAAAGAGGVVVYILLSADALESMVFFVLLWVVIFAELLFVGFAIACGARAFGGSGERGAEHFALSAGAFFTVVANTALTLPMMYLTSGSFGSLGEVYATLMLVNFLPELLVTTILTPVVVLGVRKGLRLGVDGRPRRRENGENGKEVTDD